jgi:hypothetical protein
LETRFNTICHGDMWMGKHSLYITEKNSNLLIFSNR